MDSSLFLIMRHGSPDDRSMILPSRGGNLTSTSIVSDAVLFCISTLREMIPSFNTCVDQLLETLRPLADGETPVPMKDHISDLTMDVISKVLPTTHI